MGAQQDKSAMPISRRQRAIAHCPPAPWPLKPPASPGHFPLQHQPRQHHLVPGLLLLVVPFHDVFHATPGDPVTQPLEAWQGLVLEPLRIEQYGLASYTEPTGPSTQELLGAGHQRIAGLETADPLALV